MEKITKEELLKAKIPGEETGIQVKTGFCGFCGGDCLLDFYIKDGKIIKTEGNCTLPGANGRERCCDKTGTLQSRPDPISDETCRKTWRRKV